MAARGEEEEEEVEEEVEVAAEVRVFGGDCDFSGCCWPP